LKLLRL